MQKELYIERCAAQGAGRTGKWLAGVHPRLPIYNDDLLYLLFDLASKLIEIPSFLSSLLPTVMTPLFADLQFRWALHLLRSPPIFPP